MINSYGVGFFGEYGEEVKENIIKDNAEIFSLSSELNYACHDVLRSAKINLESGKDLIVSCLFVRSLELYQSTVMLLQSGMVNGARIVLRCLLEVTFRIHDVGEREDAYRQYIGESVISQRDTAKKAKDLSSLLGVNLTGNLDDRIKELDDKISSNKWSKLSAYKLSEFSGMSALYISAYHLLSKTVHASSSDIESHLHFDSSSVVSGFGYSETDEVGHLLLSAMGFCADAAIMFGSTSTPIQDCSKIKDIKIKIENSYPDGAVGVG